MKKFNSIFLVIALTILVMSCDKEFDKPPVQVIPTGDLITIQTMRDSFPPGDTLFFSENRTLLATVSADELSGNLFKEVYIDDGTNAIILRLDASGELDRGDSIRINLTDLAVTEFAGTMQLGECNVDNMVTIIANDVFVEPLLVTIGEVVANPEAYEAKLLRFENVEFATSDIGSTYANPDASPPQSLNKTLVDCDGIEIIVRNSGYASFAGQTIPDGNGTFIGVLSEFNGEYQLKINDTDAITFDGERCDDIVIEPPVGVYLQQDFSSDNIFNGGWTTQLVVGMWNWETSSAGGPDNAPYASIDNYDDGNTASEAWLISPSINLTDATAPKLNFISAVGFTGDDMEVYLSTDYDGISLPATASWISLDPTLASSADDFFTWTPSGDIDLSSYLQDGVYIGFRYTGSDSDGATWEVDDIFVGE